MRRFLILASSLLFTSFVLAADKPATTLTLPPKPLLPQSFAGWTANSTPEEHPFTLPENHADLAELGLKRTSAAFYSKGTNGLLVQAQQFADASGAYAAFYKGQCNDATCEATAHVAAIGSAGRSTNAQHTIQFWIGDTFVLAETHDAPKNLEADLEVLAKTLPIPMGSKEEPPSLPSYLPKSGLDPISMQYALGDIGFMGSKSPLAGKIDFNTSAEVVVGQYGNGTLTLVEYPTPQMAIAQLKSIATTFQLAPQKDLPDGLLGNTSEVAWRTGPIVALTNGMPPSQSVKLAKEVHYEAVYTIDNPHGYVSDAWRAAHLYLGIFALCGILCGAAVFLGLFFGGARAIIRVLRGKPASAVDDVEFLRLNIERPERNQPPSTQD